MWIPDRIRPDDTVAVNDYIDKQFELSSEVADGLEVIEAADAQATIAALQAVIDDHNRLVREMDVRLNGEQGAAKQASLCDIVSQVQQIQAQLTQRTAELEAADLWAECEGAQRTRAADMPTEQRAINALFQAWYRLKELGWREAQYAPKDEVCLFIECGSTGIHEGHMDQDRTIWLHDAGDLWPSHAVLFKPKTPPAEREG